MQDSLLPVFQGLKTIKLHVFDDVTHEMCFTISEFHKKFKYGILTTRVL